MIKQLSNSSAFSDYTNYSGRITEHLLRKVVKVDRETKVRTSARVGTG